jgi:hypothetical protein
MNKGRKKMNEGLQSWVAITAIVFGVALCAVVLVKVAPGPALTDKTVKEVSTLPDRYAVECVDGVTILWYSKGGGGGAMTVKLGTDSKVIPCTALDK